MNQKKLCVGSLLLSVVATAIGSGIMGIMLNEVIDSYRLLPSQEGLMSSCISFGALAALVIGILFRGYIYKTQFIIGGGVLMSLMLIGKGLPLSFPLFLLLCFAMGTGMGIMDSFQSSFLTDLNPDSTAKSLGFLHGIFGVGGVMLPLILHKLLESFSWRSVYLMTGLFCMMLVLQFYVVTQYMKNTFPVMKKLEKSQNFRQIGLFLKSPCFLLLMICMLLGAMAQNGILIWTVRYVSVVLENEILAPVCLSLFWASSTVSRVLVPYIRGSSLKILGIGSVISGAAWAVGISVGNAHMMLFVCTAAGLASGCCIPLLLNEGVMFSRENTGLTTSMLMLIKTMGQILMPVLVSAVQTFYGVSNAMYFVALIFVADGIAAVAMLRMRMRENAFS